jgi:hypothetical protein
VVFAERLGLLRLDNFRYPANPEVQRPFRMQEVDRLDIATMPPTSP